jgi:hypothetical protein
MESEMSNQYRIAQIIDWTDGQGWIALIRGAQILAKFSNWADAKVAYKSAKAQS